MKTHRFARNVAILIATAITFCANTPASIAQDCNGNGIDDAIDIAKGTSGDIDGDGVPDECEVCPLVHLLPCDLNPGDSARGYTIEGDLVLVGAPGADDFSPGNADCNSGALYVLRRDGTAWVQDAKLTASDPACEDTFGGPAGVSGDWLIIGASQTGPSPARPILSTATQTACGCRTRQSSPVP